jgi:hypothetical protein
LGEVWQRHTVCHFFYSVDKDMLHRILPGNHNILIYNGDCNISETYRVTLRLRHSSQARVVLARLPVVGTLLPSLLGGGSDSLVEDDEADASILVIVVMSQRSNATVMKESSPSRCDLSRRGRAVHSPLIKESWVLLVLL